MLKLIGIVKLNLKFLIKTMELTWENLVQWINIIFVIASVFIWLFTQLVSLFLNPAWINWEFLWLTEHLKTIWIMISNVVYFIFAFVLIWIAFMNIMWKWGEWELKQSLPKFIIWVLIVPFSWFFVQFVLSLSAILTVQIILLPFDSFPDIMNKNEFLTKKIIPNNCKINLTNNDLLKEVKKGKNKSDIANTINRAYECEKGTELSIEQIIRNWDSVFSIISIYTYWILNIDGLDDFDKKEAITWIDTIIELSIKWIIDILFVLIMFILIISLWLALFVRWIWLWIYTMFSPVFWLLYFFDKWEWWWEWVTKNFNLKEFINLALVPVYVAAALSFWLLFLFITSNWITKQDNDKHEFISKDGITITLWDLKYTINWTILNWWKNWIWEFLTGLQWSVWSLIMSIFALVILWMAVMAALKSSTITWTVVEPIAQFGESIWKLAMKSPQYAPIFPGWLSAQWLNKVWQMPIAALNQKSAIKAGALQEPINRVFWANILNPWDLEKFNQSLISLNKNNLPKFQTKLKEIWSQTWTWSPQFRRAFENYINALIKAGVKIDKEKALKYEGDKLSIEWAKALILKKWYSTTDEIADLKADVLRNSLVTPTPWSQIKETKDQEWDLKLSKEKRNFLKWGVVINWNIKLNIKESWELVIWNHEWEAWDMKFENYDKLKDIDTPDKLIDNIKRSDKNQFWELLTNLDISSKAETNKVLWWIFPKLKGKKSIFNWLKKTLDEQIAKTKDPRAKSIFQIELNDLKNEWKNKDDIDYILEKMWIK